MGWNSRWCRLGQGSAFLASALCIVLTACGGSSDDGAPETDSSALTSDNAGDSAPAQRRRAHAYQRKGITALVAAPDGRVIGVANSDGRVRVLESAGTREVKLLAPRGSPVTAGLVFSADSRYLVTVTRDSTAHVWNVETGERKLTLRGHEHALRALAASGDGAVIATGGEETRVMVWDGQTGRLKRVLTGHTDFVNALSLSQDGQFLASGDADARILVWNVATGKLLYTLRGHSDEVNAVVFSPDRKLLASSSDDGKVLLWDVATGKQVQSLASQGRPVRGLAFSQDASLLAGGGVDGKVVVWDMASRSISSTLEGSNAAVNSVAFVGSDRNVLLAGTEQDQVHSWSVSRSVPR